MSETAVNEECSLIEQVRKAVESAQQRALAEGISLQEGAIFVVVLPRLDVKENESSPTEVFERPWMGPFLRWLRDGKTVTLACDLVGVSRDTVYRWKRTSQRLKSEWERAVHDL